MSTANDTPILRRCTKCGQEYPATTQYFKPKKSYKYGLDSKCKTCAHKENVRRRSLKRAAARAQKQSLIPSGYKQCATCKSILPASSEFFPMLHGRPLYRCKSCHHAHLKSYRLKNSLRINQYKRELSHLSGVKPRPQIRHGNLKLCTRCNRWLPCDKYHFHRLFRSKDGFLNYCKDCMNLSHRAQRAKNPVRSQIGGSRRRARKHNLPDNFSAQDWQFCLKYWGNRCAVCGRPRGLWHRIAADHWIPLSSPECPGTVPKNIVPLCHGIDGCNNRKYHKMPMEWLISEYGERKARRIAERIDEYFAIAKGRENE